MIYPHQSGKSIVMQRILDAHLDAGKTVTVVSIKGASVMKRHKHLTRIKFYPHQLKGK